jgi:murein L,D-transpeptidase YafK
MQRFVRNFAVVMVLGTFGLYASQSASALKALDSKSEVSVVKRKPLPKAQKVLVVKSERKLYLIRDGKPYREYHVALGGNPEGPKEREGDQKTPEGNYTLDFKKRNSSYYRAIHVSYPSEADRARAREMGVSPGGAIMIHGQPNWWGWLAPIRQRFDWTAGCIAVNNGEIDEIWEAVEPGTPIEIRP